MIKLSSIKANPKNPRVIKNEDFQRLCKSIEEFPKMMALRPMVVDEDMMVLGGNQRLKALQHLGYKEVPNEWIKHARDLTEDERRRFIITDNVSAGDWDYEALLNSWDVAMLVEVGFDAGIFNSGEQQHVRPTFTDDKPKTAPDHKYFYVEYYGMDAEYEQVVEIITPHLDNSKHVIKPIDFLNILKTYEKNRGM